MGQGICAGTATYGLSFNKPLVEPILHIVNLDASTLTITGTGPRGAAIGPPIVKNNQMEITGNTLNSTTDQPLNGGCQTDPAQTRTGRAARSSSRRPATSSRTLCSPTPTRSAPPTAGGGLCPSQPPP